MPPKEYSQVQQQRKAEAVKPASNPPSPDPTVKLDCPNRIQTWLDRITQEGVSTSFSVQGSSQYGPPAYIATVSQSNAASTIQNAKSDRQRKPKPLQASSSAFNRALADRGVVSEASKDTNIANIKRLTEKEYSDSQITQHNEDEDRWRIDLAKCKVSNETIIRRTIMMSLIDRYKLTQYLDYSCGELWISKRIPSKPEALKIAQPKPDLTVAFTTKSFMPDNTLVDFPRLGHLQGYMCPEGDNDDHKQRAFYFFSVEVEGKHGTVGNRTAHNQNLNTASQALHNIYMFMRETGHERTFFREVRFFSALATPTCFEVRVHRPVRIQCIVPGYPVGYEFAELHRFPEDYTKTDIVKIVYNILFEYGIKKLYPILKRAVEAVLESESQLQSWPEPEAESQPISQSSTEKRPFDDQPGSFIRNRRRRLDNIHMKEDEGLLVSS